MALNTRKLIPFLVGYFVVCALAVGALGWYWLEYQQAPVQPIDFSHRIHANTLGLECSFCHTGAAVSARATVPPLQRCMECHQNAATDRPEIIKLAGYWKARQPLEWVKVHDLPWHVRFTHKRHVAAGVDCTVCHGQVKAESRVRRARSLTMGWCVDCHRAKQVSVDCWVCHH